MNNKILSLLAISMCANSYGDEFYEFHRIRCAPTFSEILVEPVSFYNIGYSVWPLNSDAWADHVAAMKQLEREQGLYVFDKAYGYYDQEPISISCGKSRMDIVFQKGTHSEPEMGDEVREFRSNPMASFFYDGKLVSRGVYLGSYGITRLRIYYAPGGKSGLIDACIGARCEWLAPYKEPLGPKDYERTFSLNHGG